MNTTGMLPEAVCYCGLPAVERESTTPGNPGRLFYVCRKHSSNTDKCDFFKWADSYSPVSSSSPKSHSHKRVNTEYLTTPNKRFKTRGGSSNKTIHGSDSDEEEERKDQVSAFTFLGSSDNPPITPSKDQQKYTHQLLPPFTTPATPNQPHSTDSLEEHLIWIRQHAEKLERQRTAAKRSSDAKVKKIEELQIDNHRLEEENKRLKEERDRYQQACARANDIVDVLNGAMKKMNSK